MDVQEAVSALAALAQETRLEVFRLLVEAGPEGLCVGDIGVRLGVAAPTLSFHLSQLARAGLLESRRESRRIIYSVGHRRMKELLVFLTSNCCGGRPEICGPLFGKVALDTTTG